MKLQTALISVSDRGGLAELGKALVDMGVKILSTGGTGQALVSAGIPIVPISEYTGSPEILDGRVKTLHPRIHGGILARLDLPPHRSTLQEHAIDPIGLVVVNLYPFRRTVAREGVSLEEAVEQIDIGGPTLIRSAAKNYKHTAPVVDPSDYSMVISELKANSCELREETRRRLARKAFQHTASYDAAISNYFEKLVAPAQEHPGGLSFSLTRLSTLRYGENPHQRGALYAPHSEMPSGVVGARQLQGKELSFNNYLDLHAAWALCGEFDQPFCVIIKHNNPCGAALGDSAESAYRKAWACDPVSAFGSVIGFNRTVDGNAAAAMSNLFIEAIIAPAYDESALKLLAAKKNLRVMQGNPGAGSSFLEEVDVKKISGGFLVQDLDRYRLRRPDLKPVTRRTAAESELNDLIFAWTICKHVKSNAIVFAREAQTLGIGAGQMSRVDSVRIATQKAQSSLQGAVMASDAFFPFRDGIDEAAKAGIRSVIQPGGSVRDDEVIRAADEHDMAMVFTGIRHFKH
ncbi:MAG: bifunctional phosphoribosylaminoimidazolecarboxamide formyltransferase/IMP cyclohydrolase [Acidobacteria bacterium]|nr:bifunctional phosphoribosylaminoimidazolecarboxamide formyltransferase/IMP cyclohydrolase [Acidobacteriota bacterium]